MEQIQKNQQWYDQLIVWLIYSLGVLIPLFFSTAFFSNFAAPKLLVLRAVTLVILLLWVWKSYREEKITVRRGGLVWVLALYAGVMMLTTLTSSSIFTSLYGTETRFLGIFTQVNFLLIAWLTYNFIVTRKQLRTLVTVTTLTGIVLLMAYGWMQYFGAFQDSFSWSQDPQERVFGTLGHSNHFGAYLGMCILLGFGAIPFMKNKLMRRGLVACAHATLLVILLTGSRAALVATVLALLMTGAILVWKNESSRKFFQKHFIKFLAGAVALLALIWVFREPLSKIPVVERFTAGNAAAEQGYTPDRVSWWYSSFAMFRDRPLLGSGLGTFRDMYNTYRRNDYRVAGPGDIQYQITPESSHNDYIDILTTQGMLGLVAFLALIIFAFAGMDKKIFGVQKADEQFYLILGIKGALAVYLIQVLVNFGVVDTLTIFYVLLGAGVSASAAVKTMTIPYKRLPKTLLTCAALVLLIWGASSTYRDAFAEYAYKNAVIEQTLGRPENARTWYEEAIRQQPYRYEYYQAFADFAFKNGLSASVDPEYTRQYLELALQNYQRASLVNHYHPSTYFNMGIASTQLARLDGNDAFLAQGLNALQQAIKLSPNNPLYAFEAAKIFADLGKKELAQNALQEVVRLDPQYRDAQKRLDGLTKKN